MIYYCVKWVADTRQVPSVALVFQQVAVLEANLDLKDLIAGLCGAMNTDNWKKDTWEDHFKKNRAIVCTPEILFQCLMHSFIKICQINLLVFDEAHHTKKSHPYARIIEDFYRSEDRSKRPRIFGMTASPVDAKSHDMNELKEAVDDLEYFLDSRIATASNSALMQKSFSPPREEREFYDALAAPFETPLHQLLRQRFSQIRAFDKLFVASREASRELGSWCSDLYWKFALSEESANKMRMKHERAFNSQRSARSVEQLDAELASMRAAEAVIREHDFGPLMATRQYLSSKVLMLYDWLRKYYERPTDRRCIVFVQRRHTARLLQLVIDSIGGPYIKTGVLVGSGATTGDLQLSHRDLFLTNSKFRNGDLNCLFATSVAEEGLDIPECNLVIRFDLYSTMIQYIQSRGRARSKQSVFLHMAEKGNHEHRHLLDEVEQAEQRMRRVCGSLPEDRLLVGNDNDMDEETIKLAESRGYREASTGAWVTYSSALTVLAHFAGSLPQDGDIVPQVQYVLSADAGRFVCEAIMPQNSPVRGAVSKPQKRKLLAKCAAALAVIVKLRQGGYLDAHMVSTFTKQLPMMRNAHLALNMKNTNAYLMRLKPSLWEQSVQTEALPTKVFMTIVDFQHGLDRAHQPLAMLMRKPLPTEMPTFPIYLNDGRASMVISRNAPNSIGVTVEQLDMLTTYTLRIFLDLFNKKYEHEVEKMSYWIAPLRAGLIKSNKSIVTSVQASPFLLDWAAIELVHNNERFEWTPETPNEFVLDKFLVDMWDGGRRLFTTRINPTLRPESPLPDDAARILRKRDDGDIVRYSVSLWSASKSRAAGRWLLEGQPVVEADRVLHRRNMLATPETKEVQLRTKSYVIPEPFKISALSTQAVASCYMWPAVIHRFDSYLVALEACDVLGLRIPPSLALEAFTKDSDNSDEHNEVKKNFQRGMGNNYERLEFLGDCFLKMATSICLFVLKPGDDEFHSHVERMLMLCNKNLFETAKKLHLYEYVRSQAFSRRTWYPEGIKLLEGKGSKKPEAEVFKHHLGDKTVADVCEAMIGAAFMADHDPDNWQPSNWDQAVKAVTVLVDDDHHRMRKWDDYFAAYNIPAYQTARATAAQMDLAARIVNEHDYIFRYPRLLRSAFQHPSYPSHYELLPSYQRLEFLGDSLLDMVCVTYLIYKYPDKDPQWLTEHKMAMVSNKFLGALCVKIGFHRHMQCMHPKLVDDIKQWVEDIEIAEMQSNGAMDYWTTVKPPPKV